MKPTLAWLLFILLIALVAQASTAYRLLFAGTIATKSHNNFYATIVEDLADSGHDVTFVTSFNSTKERSNLRVIYVPEGNLAKLAINRFNDSFLPNLLSSVSKYYEHCMVALGNKQVQGLLKEKFDLLFLPIMISDCFLSMAAELKVPYIYVSSLVLMPNTAHTIGNPIFPSFEAAMVFGFGHPMTFLQRAENLFSEMFFTGILLPVFDYVMEQKCRSRGLWHDDIPSISEMQQNVSMVFVNSVRELEVPVRPYVPGIVHLGGIHCRPAKELPKDLQDWIDESEEGFILFSLGSSIKTANLPEKYRKIFVNVFARLKVRVLWKWDSNYMPDKPDNVKITNWIPQQDVLGQPKLRLFVMQGGILSIFEAIFNALPILGFPIYLDQKANMNAVERQGCGKSMMLADLTEENLYQTINYIIDSQEIKERVKEVSSIMRDQPQPPRAAAVYWTEYVVRHQGAKHLRSPILDLPWYKLYNVDIWIVFFLVTAMSMWLTFRFILAIVKCCRKKGKAKSD